MLHTGRTHTQSYSVLYTITPFPSHPVSTPGVTVPRVTSSQVEYETTAQGSATRVIAGYEVTRFGVPMIGQYVNTGRGSRVTISPAVPGAQYRITAWALGNGIGGVQHQQWWMLPLEKQVSHARYVDVRTGIVHYSMLTASSNTTNNAYL